MPNFRKVLLLVGLFIFVLVLSGCQLIGGKDKEKTVTLKYWGLWEQAPTINTLISEYKKIKPNVTISYEKKSPQQYRESITTQIDAGKGPDIFRFHNTWVPMLKDQLAPVPAGILSASDFKKNFYPTVFFDLRNSNKEFVGIPLEIDGLALFWNVDIFKAVGLTSPPATWIELENNAKLLTVRDASGKIRTAGSAMGVATNVDHFSDILGLMILQNGGDPKNPSDKKSQDAIEYYLKFAKGEGRVWDELMPASTTAFAGGNLAMYFGPSWRAIEFKNLNPTLNFKVAPVPQLPGGKVAWASYWVEGVSAQSPNSKEAWEFVKFLQEDTNLVKFYAEAAKSPGRFFGEPYPKVSLALKLSLDPLIGAIISQAPYMKSFPMASRTFDNGLNDQIIKAYEDAVNSINQGTATKSALETATKNIVNIYTRYTSSTSTTKK